MNCAADHMSDNSYFLIDLPFLHWEPIHPPAVSK